MTQQQTPTPGPWYVTDPKADGGRTWIVNGGLMPVRIAQALTGEADARLIAAAPALLEAAETLTAIDASIQANEKQEPGTGQRYRQALHDLRAAIAAATGKAQP